jgi:hypothetical protein
MKRFFKESLSPTMAVAILALVVATGGTGYAAARFGHDSVAAEQRASAPAQPVLQSGQTMVGYFTAGGASGTSGYIGEGITFPAKLPPGFNNSHVQYIEDGDPFTVRCPGLNTAKRGWMCFYEGQSSGVSLCCIYDKNYNSLATADHGVRIYWNVNASGNYVDGQWVVRAP